MQTTRFPLLPGLALAVLFTLLVGGPVFAHDHNERRNDDKERRKAHAIEGVWNVEVTILSGCGGVPVRTLPAMNMFSPGGLLTEAPGSTQVPPPPIMRGSPGLGTWQHVKGRHYTAVFRFFRLNPDGSFAGTQKITQDIVLSKDGDEFTAAGTAEIFDASGTLILSGCNTETATRLE